MPVLLGRHTCLMCFIFAKATTVKCYTVVLAGQCWSTGLRQDTRTQCEPCKLRSHTWHWENVATPTQEAALIKANIWAKNIGSGYVTSSRHFPLAGCFARTVVLICCSIVTWESLVFVLTSRVFPAICCLFFFFSPCEIFRVVLLTCAFDSLTWAPSFLRIQ